MPELSENEERGFSAKAAQVSKHSQRIRHLRLATPALAVGLLLTYALSATPPQVDREFIEQFSGLEMTKDGEGVRLSAPRYAGEDLSGRPFEVAAQSAVRGQSDADPLALDRPEARRVRADGQTSVVRSREGTFDQDNQLVDLIGDVELEQEGKNGKFVIRTDAAKADLENQVVTSAAEVRGEGDTGTLRADRATIYQNEDRVVLEGGVNLTFKAKPKTDEAEEEPEKGDAGS
jgi:lipopolysaccharide export system protein LptC